MRPLPAAATVFDRADLRACDWSDAAIGRAVAAGRLVRVRRGQFARPTDAGPSTRGAAAVRACAGSALSHGSAAVLHGLPLLGPRPPRPEITVPPRGPGSFVGAHLHRATLLPDDVCTVSGTAVTTVARTLLDLARQRPVTTSVVAIDAALHAGAVTVGELEAVWARCWNWPGIGRARRAIRVSDGRSESPLESISRLVLDWLRLPRPVLQPVIRDRAGRQVARLDFYWDEFGVAGEADGRSKYDDRQILLLEKERQERAEDLGLVFVRWRWEDPVRRPQRLRTRLLAAFERGRLRDASGLSRSWQVCDS